jgi:hypothetical protein
VADTTIITEPEVLLERAQLNVIDSYTDEAVRDVSIGIMGFDTAVTDDNGFVEFNDLKVGSYNLILQKTDYASIRSSLSVEYDTSMNSAVLGGSGTYHINKMGVSAEGYVYIEDENSVIPAEDAEVELRLPAHFTSPFLNTSALESGKYTFDSLPENTEYEINVKSYRKSGKDYILTAPIKRMGNRAGDVVIFPTLILQHQLTGDLIVLWHNLDEITLDDPATIVFSEPIDVSEIGFDDIVLKMGSSTILKNVTWSDDYDTLFITPHNDAWTYSQYSIVLSLTGENGISYAETHTFDMHSDATSLGNVKNIALINAVDYNTSSIILNWDKVNGAVMYDIYMEQSGDNPIWLLVKDGISDTTASISTPNYFINGQTRKYMVLARSGSVTSDPDAAESIIIKDEISPVISTDRSTVSISPSYKTFNNIGLAQPDTIDLVVSLRNSAGGNTEPLDTTEAPTITVHEGGVSEIGSGDSSYTVSEFSWQWFGLTTGILTTIVDPDVDGRLDTLKIDFSGIKDIAGNEINASPGRGIVKHLTY